MKQVLKNAKASLKKRNKVGRFAEKSPAGWVGMEEYESDELADDSEDEKKLRSAESSQLRLRKKDRTPTLRFKSPQLSSVGVGNSSYHAACQPFWAQQTFPQQPFRVRQPRPFDKCFRCGQCGHCRMVGFESLLTAMLFWFVVF